MNFIHGDCLSVLPAFAESSFDVCVCDPPYALSKGQSWDTIDVPAGIAPTQNGLDYKAGATGQAHSHGLATHDPVKYQEWCRRWGAEVFRVLKPGGLLLAWGGPRTFARMIVGLEDAGFGVRDVFSWLFSHGYPKGIHNLGTRLGPDWEGWSSVVRPAWEPITLLIKPFKGTLTENVRTYQTGALNRGDAWPTNVLVSDEEQTIPRAFYNHKASPKERFGWCYSCQTLVSWEDAHGEHGEHAVEWHPSVKPINLVSRCVRLVTRPGAMLLDPFCGTGTVAAVARGITENVTSIEVNETYWKIAQARNQ